MRKANEVKRRKKRKADDDEEMKRWRGRTEGKKGEKMFKEAEEEREMGGE